MRVKDLADLADTTVRTIRYYHQLGLLALPDAGTTWRSYGFTHLTRLMRIRWLVESGVPLADVPHMLRPPATADERGQIIEDLEAILASIDEKAALIAAQRSRVVTLRERVTTQGRLSPMPVPIFRLYEQLLDRPLSPGVAEAMTRERDLVELACYRTTIPEELIALVDAVGPDHLDEICWLWEEAQRINTLADIQLTGDLSGRIDDVVRRTVALATRVDPVATQRLLARAAELDRPAVRAAVDLAYPFPAHRAHRQFLLAFVRFARHGGVA